MTQNISHTGIHSPSFEIQKTPLLLTDALFFRNPGRNGTADTRMLIQQKSIWCHLGFHKPFLLIERLGLGIFNIS